MKTEQEQLKAVRKNGFAIQLIKNPSETVQLEAVKQKGSAIKYIKNPSENVQLEAVKQDGYAIQYIKTPSKEVIYESCKELLKRNCANCFKDCYYLKNHSCNITNKNSILTGIIRKEKLEKLLSQGIDKI